MKIFKKYNSEKGRTTPIVNIEGRSFGFLAARDAVTIACADAPGCNAITVNTAIFSDGSSITRTFTMVRYGKELLRVSWDGEKPVHPNICITTHTAFNNLLTQFAKDSRWTRIDNSKQLLANAAAHLMSEYRPATSTIDHHHYCYSGDLAAVDLLNKIARSL